MPFGDESFPPGVIVVILAAVAGGGMGLASEHEFGKEIGLFLGIIVGIFLACQMFGKGE